MGRVLIVGGTGTLGGYLTRRLLAGGTPVRVMSRQAARAAALRSAGAEVVEGDLLDGESLLRACDGAEVVVAAAHSLLGRGPNASPHVDGAGHLALIRAAQTTGASRFVYISAYAHDPAYHQIPFFRLKLEVEARLKASGLTFTIVRPTAFMDFHAHVLIGTPILEKRKVVLVGRGERPRNFVAADDVARLVVLALGEVTLAGETVDIGGPENLTTMDVVRRYERIAGTRARLLHVPRSVAVLVSRAARPIHFGLSQVLQIAAVADAVDQRFDARPFQRRFPIPLTPLDDWIAQHVTAGHHGFPEKPSVPV